ncbi:hypothetical protein QJS66_22770 [Kocuria rhizophila]|nr:hypothetical protein QJS66_22770 [Kocuria rhizophila]
MVTFTDPALTTGRRGRLGLRAPAQSGPPPDVAAAARDVADSGSATRRPRRRPRSAGFPTRQPAAPRPGPRARTRSPAAPVTPWTWSGGRSAEHWSGRAAWRAWEDGVALIGRPAAVHGWFLALLRAAPRWRCPASPPRTRGAVRRHGIGPRAGRGWPARGRGRAPGTAGMDELTNRGRGAPATRSAPGPGGAAGVRLGARPRSVLAVEDWDRCCQHFRQGPGPILEDDALAPRLHRHGPGARTGHRRPGPRRAGPPTSDRPAAPAGRDRARNALLHWPRLPPVLADPGRAAERAGRGPVCAGDRCSPRERMAVVQLAGGDAARWSRTTVESATTTAVPDTALGGRAACRSLPWPPAFPLPRSWTSPDRVARVSAPGVTRDGSPRRHPGPRLHARRRGPGAQRAQQLPAAARAHLLPEAGADQRPSTARHDALSRLHTAEDVTARGPPSGGVHRPTTVVLDDADRLTSCGRSPRRDGRPTPRPSPEPHSRTRNPRPISCGGARRRWIRTGSPRGSGGAGRSPLHGAAPRSLPPPRAGRFRACG